MLTITKGENKKIAFNMLQANGTDPLLRANIDTFTLDLLQGEQVLKSYTWSKTATGELRDGGTTSQILLELTVAESTKLPKGTINYRSVTKVTDATFLTGGKQECIVQGKLLEVKN